MNMQDQGRGGGIAGRRAGPDRLLGASGEQHEAATSQPGRLLRARGGQRARHRGVRGAPPTARASPSRRRTAPPATRAAPSRAARRRRRALLARARRDPPGRRGPGRRGLEGQRRPRASLTSSVVVFVVREGNPRTSRPGTTWSSRASRSSPRTRPRPARRSGTSSPPGPRASPTAAPRPRPRRSSPKLLRATPSPCPAAAATRPRRSPSGNGDVLLSYENEAILARQNGEDFDYVVPPTTRC